MLFTVNLDEDNFILSLAHTNNDNVEIDVEDIDMQYLNAYQLINGIVTLNAEKKAELVEAEEQEAKDEEIAELEKNLNDTDYIMARMLEEIMGLSNPLTFITDMLLIFANYATKYREALANRKTWRARIEELRK